MRGSGLAFAPKGLCDSSRASLRRALLASFLPCLEIALSLRPRPGGCLAFLRRRQLHASAARLREANGDGLRGGASAMLSFADMIHLFANEFSRLRARRLPFSCVLSCPFNCVFLRHNSGSSPCLDASSRESRGLLCATPRADGKGSLAAGRADHPPLGWMPPLQVWRQRTPWLVNTRRFDCADAATANAPILLSSP